MNCSHGGYCHNRVIEDSATTAVEQCIKCGKKLFYQKAERGRIDNKQYLLDHPADFAQPHGRTGKIFKQVHGEKVVKEAEKAELARRAKIMSAQDEEDLARQIRKDFKQKVILH